MCCATPRWQGVAEVLVLHQGPGSDGGGVMRRGPGGAWDEHLLLIDGATSWNWTSVGFSAPLAAFYRTA